jgi:hypothetical protein
MGGINDESAPELGINMMAVDASMAPTRK